MRYIIFAITILILMLSVGIAHADTWRPPATCDDDRREIKGNRTSPCKFPTPELENIEYRVRMEYPKCYGELRFYVKGIAPLPSEYIFLGISIYEYKERGYQKTLYGSEWRNRPTRNQTIHDGFIVGPGGPYPGRWDVRSQMPTESVSKAEAGTPVFAGIWIQDSAHGKNWAYYSNVIPYPSLPGPGETANLINACLSQLEHEAIKREANRKATISALELIALHQEKIQTAENELLKTQALKAELEYRETAGAILQEIARIRLAGRSDRVKLLNEHLERVRQSSEDFDIETSAVEDMIQQYIDFNESLIAEIDGYQTKLQERLNSTLRDIANQQAELDALEQEARDIALPEGSQ